MEQEARAWSSLSDEDHEFHYNPQRAFPDFGKHRELRAPANREALSRLPSVLDLAYGENPSRRLDIFPARREDGSPAPVHVFLHGGYWRAQDKANYAYIAGTLVPTGITTVIANYELCPGATLDGVVDSALAALEWTWRNIADHGGDASAISISGHSAGAHLCAEALAADWTARGIDPDFIRAAVMISGIYDPAPAARTSVNAQLRLDAEIADRHDMERRPPRANCPVSLFVGGREPWHWIEQTFRYSHHLRRHGLDPAVEVLPGYGHFDIIDQYRDPAAPILAAVLEGAGRPAAPTSSERA